MKRRLLWLTLPIVLLLLVLGMKWRIDHPTPTKEDLRIRQMLLKGSKLELEVVDHQSTFKPKTYTINLSKQETRLLADSFYLSPQKDEGNGNDSGVIVFHFMDSTGLHVKMVYQVVVGMNRRAGYIEYDSQGTETMHDIRPITVRRWTEFLLNDPRIGSELRAHLNR